MSNCFIGAHEAAVLAQTPMFAHVEVLTLNINPLGDKGLAALAQSPYLANLAELNLTSCDIGNDGLKALAKANLPKLRHLWISYNKYKSLGVQALAKAPWFGQLCSLSLGGVKFGVQAAEALARVRPMRNLYYMYCGDVTDADARAILKKRFKGAVSF